MAVASVTSVIPHITSLIPGLGSLLLSIPSATQVIGYASLWFLSQQWGLVGAAQPYNPSFGSLSRDNNTAGVVSRVFSDRLDSLFESGTLSCDLGDAFYQKGLYLEAAGIYKRLLPEAQGCEKGQLLGRLGILKIDENDSQGAIALFQGALELCPVTDPFHLETLTRLATVYMNMKEYSEARELLNSAFELAEPGAYRAVLDKDYDKALQLLDAVWEAMNTPEESPLGGAIELGRLLVAKSAIYCRKGELDQSLKYAQDAEAHFLELQEGEYPDQYTIFSALSHVMQAGAQTLNQNDDTALELYNAALKRLVAIEKLTASGQGGLVKYSQGLGYNLVQMRTLCERFVAGGKAALEAYRQLLSLGKEKAPSEVILEFKNTGRI